MKSDSRKFQKIAPIEQQQQSQAPIEEIPEIQEAESLPGAALRHATRLGTKALTGAATIPSAVIDLPVTVGNIGYKLATGKESEVPSNILSQSLGLPSQQQLEEKVFNKVLPKGYLESPEGSWQEFFDKIASGAGGFRGLGSSLAGSVAKSALGEVGAEASKKLPLGRFSDVGQLLGYAALAESPKIFGRGLHDAVNQSKIAKYQESRNILQEQNIGYDPRNLYERNIKFQSEINRPAVAKKNPLATEVVNEVVDTINETLGARNNVPAGEILDLKTYANDKIAKINSGEIKLPASQAKAAVNELKRIVGSLNEGIDDIAKKAPEFEASYRPAEEIHKAQALARETGNFINENSKVSKYLKNDWVVKALLGTPGGFLLGTFFGHATIPKLILGAAGTAATAAGINAAQSGIKLATLVRNSPEAFKIYKDLVSSAIKQDAAAFTKKAVQLDRLVTKSEKQNPDLFEEKPTIQVID